MTGRIVWLKLVHGGVNALRQIAVLYVAPIRRASEVLRSCMEERMRPRFVRGHPRRRLVLRRLARDADTLERLLRQIRRRISIVFVTTYGIADGCLGCEAQKRQMPERGLRRSLRCKQE